MADFKFKIVAGQRLNAVGTIFKFDVRTPGITSSMGVGRPHDASAIFNSFASEVL